MARKLNRGSTLAALLLAALAIIFAGTIETFAQKGGEPRVVGGIGTARVQGQDALVEVLVEIAPGEKAQAAVVTALRGQGAIPLEHSNLGSGGFTTTGLVWSENPTQNYNSGSANTHPEPVASKQSLLNTHTTWSGVETAWIEMEYGEDTTRCPSLVRECKGPQTWDGYNDVAWLSLRPGVLGVAWFGDGPYGPEVDIALSTRFGWSTDNSGGYDVETVLLHENGHLLGLGHSSYEDAVMYAYYTGINRELHSDDIEGLTYLYDNDITGVVSGVISGENGPIEGAIVELVGTGKSATTNADGFYVIISVPDPVTYDTTASAAGYQSVSVRQTIDGETTVDFILDASEEEEEEEDKCPPGWQRQGRC